MKKRTWGEVYRRKLWGGWDHGAAAEFADRYERKHGPLPVRNQRTTRTGEKNDG